MRYAIKVRTHEATNCGDISPVENTPGDKSRGNLEFMRHVAGGNYVPDKISHGAYDGICPCNMSPQHVLAICRLVCFALESLVKILDQNTTLYIIHVSERHQQLKCMKSSVHGCV